MNDPTYILIQNITEYNNNDIKMYNDNDKNN